MFGGACKANRRASEEVFLCLRRLCVLRVSMAQASGADGYIVRRHRGPPARCRLLLLRMQVPAGGGGGIISGARGRCERRAR